MSVDAGRIRGALDSDDVHVGERVLWQGGPAPSLLARHALHVRKVALYFVLLLLWRVGNTLYGGGVWGDVAQTATTTILFGVTLCSMLWIYARWAERSTTYTITDKRIAIRTGVALQITVTIPLEKIESAGLIPRGETGGDVVLHTARDARVAYFVLWPSVQPFRIRHPRPMLRCLEDARSAADALKSAIEADMRQVAPKSEPLEPWLHDDDGEPDDHHDDNMLSTVPLRVMGAFALLAIVGVAWQQYFVNPNADGQAYIDSRVLAESLTLRFVNLPDGSVSIQELDGRVRAVVPSGDLPFMRVTVRGLMDEREVLEADMSPGVELRKYEDRTSELVDLSTGRRIDLRAFGQDPAGQFTWLFDTEPAAPSVADTQ
ncbi:MAG: photosynthetic complex putative assembly protein PuhB [Pseudomonadota bacterium]